MNELRILLLEDNTADAELLEHTMRTSGLIFTALRVDTEAAFTQALNKFRPDIVLVDYQLPSYSGHAAINHLRQFHPDIPAIVVTGSIGEVVAVELLKAGAKDYVLKDRPMRLPAAIRAVLQAQEEIRLRRKAEQQLRETEALLRSAQAIAHLGSWYWNVAGNETSWSDETFRIFGYAPWSVAPSRELFLHGLLVPEDRETAMAAIRALLEARENGEAKREFRIRRPDGEVRHIVWQAELTRDEEGNPAGLVGTVMDITEHSITVEKIRKLAFFDMLTQLPNRRLLLDRLWQTMSTSQRNRKYGALMFIDLDNFKLINDQRGSEAGDLLLIEVAHRISGCLRATDTVARFGGDEFVVMLDELDTDEDASAAETRTVAEKVRSTLAEPYVLSVPPQDGAESVVVEYRGTASIGVALFLDHQTGAEDILRGADMAMYQAKSGGGNRICFFNPQSSASADAGVSAKSCVTLPPVTGNMEEKHAGMGTSDENRPAS
ncbi:MAG TPA: diguanylate cyclase [Gallionella sp.]|nr:diguanylate cyclase [Gallionella sp.]